MKVGVCMIPGNFEDWDRFLAHEKGESVPSRAATPDESILLEDIAMHERVEELGFDSFWTVEHHFTPYALVTNPLQLLTYFAARTQRIDLGTMVVVLPWHNPVRVAEDMSFLQTVMGGDRNARIGFGRGLGRREFQGLGIDQESARGRFVEGIEVIRRALSEDSFSFEGEHFTVPKSSLRPRAVEQGAALVNNMLGSWGSPSSAPIVGKAGLKPLIIPLEPWENYIPRLETIAQIREEADLEPARPVALVAIFCDEDEEKARDGANRYMPQYLNAGLIHYEFEGDHFKELPSYADYADRGAQIRKSILETKGEDLNFVWGTPQMCIEEVERIRDLVNPSELVVVCRYGEMPLEIAERNLNLVASKVRPALQSMPLAEPAETTG